jgi:hypothetical protein
MENENEYYQEAKDYFVVKGYSIDTIAALMKGKTTKRVLNLWRKDSGWDGERRKRMASGLSLREDIYSLIQSSIEQAKADPSSANLMTVARMIGALKTLSSVRLDGEEEKDKNKSISQDTIIRIEKLLGL